MTRDDDLFGPTWSRLSPAQQDWVRAELARLRPLEEWDPEHVRRLAVALGLRPASR